MKIVNPFSPKNIVGYVSEVSAGEVRIHFPDSQHLNRFYNHGKDFHGGIVGSYIVIEGETKGFLGKFVKVSLTEKERKNLTEEKYKNTEFHPVGYVELLFSFDLLSYEPEKSINNFPSVGSKAYVTNSEFYISLLNEDKDEFKDDKLNIGEDLDTGDNVKLSANKLFQRHCAIVGTTGGGKSYTVSKIIEELINKEGAKVLLLDPTGEFASFDTEENKGYKFCKNNGEDLNEIVFNYVNLNFEDIVAFLRPGGQSQLPILEESLKILSSLTDLNEKYDDNSFVKSGDEILCFKKEKQLKKPFLDIISNTEIGKYDINNLSIQMGYASVYENDFDSFMKFGGLEPKTIGYIQSVIFRLKTLLSSKEANKIFNFLGKGESSNICFDKLIEEFYNGDSHIFRIDLSNIPDEIRIREILVNAIGKNLLIRAKNNEFAKKPLIIFIDEAHLFLGKIIKDEHSVEVELNAFERIAKECRKYGLFLCIATQRPRDIPEGILSQIGTFIVHRLINDKDKLAIENAVSNYNKAFLNFLPSLGKGEALIMGVEFLTTLFLKIQKTNNPPNSNTPELFK